MARHEQRSCLKCDANMRLLLSAILQRSNASHEKQHQCGDYESPAWPPCHMSLVSRAICVSLVSTTWSNGTCLLREADRNEGARVAAPNSQLTEILWYYDEAGGPGNEEAQRVNVPSL